MTGLNQIETKFIQFVKIIHLKVKRMQRLGTEALRTKIQPLKPKWEITYITNSQNTKRTHGQQS